MEELFFKEVASIMKEYGLVRRIEGLGRIYYIEFQTKPINIDGEVRKYAISGLSKDKKAVYEAMVKIHERFNLDLSFLMKSNYKDIEEYLFYFPKEKIDAKFSSYVSV